MKRQIWLLVVILIITLVVAVSIGSVQVPLEALFEVLFNNNEIRESYQQFDSILTIVRIPRVLTVTLVGMALSLSGGIMQGLLQNPLADGSTLGVASGASLGAIIFILFGSYIPRLTISSPFIGASLGAFLSLIIILGLARIIDRNYSNITVILVGIIFSMLTSSVINFLITIAGDRLRTIVFWSMGSLSGSKYEDVIILLLVVLIAIIILYVRAVDLNAFTLGEDHARNIGVDVKKSRLLFMIIASVLIGTSVAIAGNIAFVGLIIPHITRMITGPNHRRLFPVSALIGGIFLAWADLIARTIAAPKELPIGVITSFVGTIVFLIILVRQKRGVL